MKNLFTAISLLICVSGVKAQINLDHYYPGGNHAQGIIRSIHLSSHGYMYASYNPNVSNIFLNLYNLNHSLYKSIAVPPLPSGTITINYISDSLFNTTPSNIEYLVNDFDATGIAHVRVFDDLGNTLFSKDSAQLGYAVPFFPSVEPIFYTSTGYKMILMQTNASANDTGAYIYSLPGALPCNECANGVIVSSVSPDVQNNSGSLMNAYPNPAKNSTTINYELPYGVNQGEIVFYDLQGREVKTFTVDRTFNSLLISTTDLAAGTYLYVLRAGGIYVGSKKMVIIK